MKARPRCKLFCLSGLLVTSAMSGTAWSAVFENALESKDSSKVGVVSDLSKMKSDIEFEVAPVPEPATALVGAVGVFALLRRRR